MPRTIRFHLDEHIDPAVADGLRRRQIDVMTAADADLLGAEDDAHLSFANAHGAVVVTNDSDFLRFHQRGENHCGIAYCQPQTRSVGEIICALELIWEVLDRKRCPTASNSFDSDAPANIREGEAAESSHKKQRASPITYNRNAFN